MITVLEPIDELRGEPPLPYVACFILCVIKRRHAITPRLLWEAIHFQGTQCFVLVTLTLKRTMKKNCPKQAGLKLKIVY